MKKAMTVLEYVVMILFTVGATLFLSTFIVRPAEVNGSSMYPTLQDKEKVLTNVFEAIFFKPERFDIVVVKTESNQEWVKRVIALPNETIEVKNNILYINNQKIEQPFLESNVITNDFGKVTLKEDEYFVMGDNREHSSDSRTLISSGKHFKKSQIISRHAYVYYPLNRMRVLK